VGLVTLVVVVAFVWVYTTLRRRISDLESHVRHPEGTGAGRRLNQLEQRLDELEELVHQGGAGTTAAPPLDRPPAPAAPPEPVDEPMAPAAAEEEPPEESVEAPELVTVSDPRWEPEFIVQSLSTPPAARAAYRAPRPSPPAPSELQQRVTRFERQLIENWTGILGSVVLVAGITFIGGYAGLRLSPFYRSLMIVAAAAALAAGSWLLEGRAKWKPLGQWLRSSGAAVFLFACFASSAIPGLRWVTALGPALAILLLGVAANLYVAYTAGQPAFASLHVVLSMVPLILVPQSDLTMVLATLVTAAGLALAYRARWDLHPLITLAAFGVFHAAWYNRALAPLPELDGRVIGALSTLLVGVIAALTHYRRTYASDRIKTLPFLVHLASWTVLATGFAIYIGNTPLRGAALIGAAVPVFFLARRAKTLGIRWVYLTDTLAGQALALVGVISFYPFAFHWLLVPAVLFLQAGLYLKIAIDEDEDLLERVGIHVLHIAAAVLAVAGLAALNPDPVIGNQNAVILLASAILGAGIHLYLHKVRGEVFDSLWLYGVPAAGGTKPISLLGFGVGVIAAVAVINLIGGRWMTPAGVAASIAFVLLARWRGSSGLGAAASLTLVLAHLLSWYSVYARHPQPAANQLLYHLGPLTVAGAAAIAYAAPDGVGRFLRHSAMYLVGLTLAVAGYTLLQPLSSLVPGVAWLILSLVALEVANRVQHDHVAPPLHLGYVYLACFSGAYVLVVLQTPAYLGPIPVRVLVEGFALAIGGYWWLYRPTPDLARRRSWRAVHPLFLELGLAFLAVVTVVEVAAQWRPLAWAGLALVSVAKPLGGTLDGRFRFYSLLFFWASVSDLVVVTSGLATPSPLWYQHPAFAGGLTIAMQVLYLATASPQLNLAGISFPPALAPLSAWCQSISARLALWLYYPFFVSGALFLYWRFEAALLTLLWAAEAFVVFVLSLFLREGHFRYMALAGLAGCFIRLLVYDMAQANLGLRGVVFVGVGLLMLGMNTLYNKYKDRFA